MARKVRARSVRRKNKDASQEERPRRWLYRLLAAVPACLWRGLARLLTWIRRGFEALARAVTPDAPPRVVRVAVA